MTTTTEEKVDLPNVGDAIRIWHKGPLAASVVSRNADGTINVQIQSGQKRRAHLEYGASGTTFWETDDA